LEPYEVWIKKDENVTARQIYDEIQSKELKIQSITSVTDRITESKNDPALQGTNGSLNLGFVVTMAICTIGFLIYWILSIQGRVLQFGILRAMGLSLKKILGMLVTEQVLVSAVSIFIGIIVGGITSQLFVPLLGIIQDSATQLLPFKVTARQEDYIKVYYMVSGMMTLGIAVLGVIISRIKINQALKLGED
jgi:putative ABC transport system permease protein